MAIGDEEQTDELDDVSDEANLEERYFHCPYCDNFKSEEQIVIGDHVVINHSKEHIARNSQPPETHECSLCQKKVNSVNQLQDHPQTNKVHGHNKFQIDLK